MGRGALGVAQRPAPLRSRSAAAIGVFGRGQIAECAVRSDIIVVLSPSIQHSADLGKRGEERLVEQFIAQATLMKASSESGI
jgi:hypothetical protein